MLRALVIARPFARSEVTALGRSPLKPRVRGFCFSSIDVEENARAIRRRKKESAKNLRDQSEIVT
jgi:hypothetical protein